MKQEAQPATVGIPVLQSREDVKQKNVPKYAPSWVRTVSVWAEASHRQVSYALCDDRRTLLWFANQRAVEYHPALFRGEHATHLVLDLDPPVDDAFPLAVRAARLVRQALDDAGRAARRRRSLGRADARAAAPAGRPGRAGAHDPDRPGPGHARGQTPRPRPPRGMSARRRAASAESFEPAQHDRERAEHGRLVVDVAHVGE
ncbi:hypothetical protein [Nonomuraea cavernae]|uniref:non-homologous end-joining DNA ligase LigD n=1 Tax=Nonomuraea cavernae TaxID=2045107 RepID=UPI0033EB94F5